MKLKITITGPKTLIDIPKFKAGVGAGMDAATEEIAADFAKTTATWKHKVSFKTTKQGYTMRQVEARDEIYGYVSEGTRPHVIVARGHGLTIFGGGAAKTQRRVIGSGAGSKGGIVAIRREVHHPGTEAREFEQAIAERAETVAPQLIQEGIDRAV